MIKKSTIENIIDCGLSCGADFVEVFYEDTLNTNILSSNDGVKNGVTGRDYGVGIRLIKDLKNIYTYTNNINEDNLIKLVKEASFIFNTNQEENNIILPDLVKAVDSNIKIRPSQVDYKKKVDFTKDIIKFGMDYNPLIKKINVIYLDFNQYVKIANSEGLYIEDERIKTRTRIGAMAMSNSNSYMAYAGKGGMKGFELYDEINIEDYINEACDIAINMVDAKNAPSGRMPVIIDNGFCGLLFHEACGHSLEATSVSKGASVFSGKVGTKVAFPEITLIDDGSLPNLWGSLNIDDEGNPTQKNILIENGILKGYMIDRLNGKRMGEKPSGNSRRQNYRFAPTARMTNTYIENGTSKREDIIKNTEKGLFVTKINAGSVNSVTGEFNFSTMEAFLIDNGKITEPVKGATLIGNGKDILKDIDMVADNLEIGEGYCYAQSGSIFIGAGQPTVRIKDMTVGGID